MSDYRFYNLMIINIFKFSN